MPKRKVVPDIEYVQPKVTLTVTETVKLSIPTKLEFPGFSASEKQTAKPTVNDLRSFVRAVEDQFGRDVDVDLDVAMHGISATVRKSRG